MLLLKLSLICLCVCALTVTCQSNVAHKAEIVPVSFNEDVPSEDTLLEEEGSGQDIDLASELPEQLSLPSNTTSEVAAVPTGDEFDRLASDRAEREELEREASDRKRKVIEHDCHSKVDLVFLLDTSGSIEQIYQEHVRWAVALVESLPIEQDTVRVAAVQYAGFPLTEFALGTYPNAEDIRQHLAQINFQSGVTRTGYALRKAEAELFRSDRGARVVIYVVSVGNDGFELEMNRIAGSKDKVFGPEELPRLRNALIAEAERARACIRVGSSSSNRFGAANKPLQVVQAAAPIETSLSKANFLRKLLKALKNEDNLAEITTNQTQTSNALNITGENDQIATEATTSASSTSTLSSTSTSAVLSNTTKGLHPAPQALESLGEADVFEDISGTATRRVLTSRAPTSTNAKPTSTRRTSTSSASSTLRPATPTSRRRLHFTVRPQTLHAAEEPIISVGVGRAIPFGAKGNRKALPVSETTPRRLTTTTTRGTTRKISTTTSRPTTSPTTRRFTPTPTSRPRAFANVNRKLMMESRSVYDEQKAYLGDILDQIQLGQQAHRVALLQFAGSEIQKTEWSYDAFEDNAALMNAFNQVQLLF
uniref:VWFA domain-containing protein n=1 Tax=Ditylenchus dipsaci TaxID=166011 RepID=A0A915CZL8_9BILA